MHVKKCGNNTFVLLFCLFALLMLYAVTFISCVLGGPRTCLGQNMALLEMKCVVARLLHNFEFRLEEDPDRVTYINTLVLPIDGGMRVAVKPRTSAGFREF